MNGEISHILWHISAIRPTQEAEVSIQGQSRKVIKSLSQKQAKDDEFGQNIMYFSMKI
jgi:hypothetical protein